MKKLSTLELVIVGFILLFICLVISIIGHSLFNINTDFLTAGATLFAAVVAMLLFEDWRDQHKVTLMDAFHLDLRENSDVLFKTYLKILPKVMSFNGSSAQGALNILDDLKYDLSDFNDNLQSLNKVIIDYQIFTMNLESTHLIKGQLEDIERIQSLIEATIAAFVAFHYSPNPDAFIQVLYSSFVRQGKIDTFISTIKNFIDIDTRKFYMDYLNKKGQ
ncbi:hypothetical protein [Acinetobacter brisouii]|uniref:hypothetical protein n=1 Tax=Acinetobacter brisouii TaxID=396323 RepID=UPI00124CD7C4|nr:hypothetical protein [Acinetobacter brisouii]